MSPKVLVAQRCDVCGHPVYLGGFLGAREVPGIGYMHKWCPKWWRKRFMRKLGGGQ